MKHNKHYPKLTKSELIKTGIFSVILALVFLYSLYKSTAASRLNLIVLIICAAIGLAILFSSIYAGIKIGLKNRKQIMAFLQEDKKYRYIWMFGISAMFFGAFLNTNPVLQIAWMLAGFGLIRTKRWGLYTFIILAVAYSVLTIVDVLSGSTLQLLKQVLPNKVFSRNVAIGIVFLIRGLTLTFYILGISYFTRPGVKERFK